MIYICMFFLLLDWLLSFCSILLLRYIEDCSFDLIAQCTVFPDYTRNAALTMHYFASGISFFPSCNFSDS